MDNFTLGKHYYHMEYKEGSLQADLYTFNKESGLNIHIIIEEKVDTDQRMSEFWQLMAKNIVDLKMGRKTF